MRHQIHVLHFKIWDHTIGEDLPEEDAKRPYIALLRVSIKCQGLWRQVANGPGLPCLAYCIRPVVVSWQGEAEITHLDTGLAHVFSTEAEKQHVARSQVAVHELELSKILHTLARLLHHHQTVCMRHLSFQRLKRIGQRAVVGEFGNEQVISIVFALPEKANESGMPP